MLVSWKGHLFFLSVNANDNEQYSRRTSLRINGIEVQEDEDGDSPVQSVERILGGIPGVVLPENSIERANRVGKPRTGEDGKKNQQMIVKLKSWKVQTNIYIKNGKVSNQLRYINDEKT